MNDLVIYSARKEILDSLGIFLCHLGCNKTAYFYSKKSNSWRCSTFAASCERKREIQSKSRTGINHPMFGKHLSSENKIKLSKALKGRISPMKGRKHSEESKRKIGESGVGSKHWSYGKSRPEETRKKISESLKGEKSPNYGKSLSPEAKEALRKLNLGKKLSKEHRQKISIATSEYLSKIGGLNGHYRRVKIFEVKNILGEEFKLQGTYEKRTAEFLNSKNILWTRGRRFSYILNSSFHFYTPDFYLPDFGVYLETKGWFQDNDKLKMRLVLEQNDIEVLMIFEKDIKNLDGFWKSFVDKKGGKGLAPNPAEPIALEETP